MTILSRLSGINTENYKKLEYLLKRGNWEEADSETARLMLLIGTDKKREIPYLNQEEIKKFSYPDLLAINVLWDYYSDDNKFGFTRQASLWDVIIENKHKKQHFPAFFDLICGYFKWVVFQENKLIINSLENVEQSNKFLPRWTLAIILTGPRTSDVVWTPGLKGLEILNSSIQILGTGSSLKMINAFLTFEDREINILKDFFSLVGNSKLNEETIKIVHNIGSSQLDQKLYKEFPNIKNSSNISEDESIESKDKSIESTKSEIESIGETA
ncbi:MAG: GUN4 domain-containing protein [Planktothrix sp. GU0601_MAG3]|nr:MAG: GUN4 domain-containing protein [Planktothrix sp. GU0601_MAG3]